MKALISDIQHCCTHDGPGIRTAVFFKGCNMRCAWCHNPETVHPKIETLYSPDKCIMCGKCDDGCYSGAKTICGKEMSIDEVLIEIMLDKPYYGNNGGITVTGGEPTLQFEFVKKLFSECKSLGISTAIETNMSTDLAKLLELTDKSLCDLIMCDIKTFSDSEHRKFTGISNTTILRNIKAVAESGTCAPMIIRTPVITGINDTETEIRGIAEIISKLPNVLYYELLTYHPLGMSKGASEFFVPTQFERPSKEKMQHLADTTAEALKNLGAVNVYIDSINHTKK